MRAVVEKGPYALVLGFAALALARMTATIDGVRSLPLFDDAMISMRYGRNLADGFGLVYNPGGEAVEGYTNLLWTLVMAAAHLLPISEAASALVVFTISIACVLVTVRCVGDIVRHVGGDPTAVVVARWLAAASFSLLYWAALGMEVGFVAMLLALATAHALRFAAGQQDRDLRLAAAMLALAFLARPDVAVPGAVIVAWSTLQAPTSRWRVLGTFAAIVGGTVVAVTAWRLAYYGDPLPNTYYLKVEGVSLGARVRRGAGGLVTMGLAGLFAPLALAVTGAVTERRRPGIWLLAGVVVGQFAYAVYVGGDSYDLTDPGSRYLAVVLPELVVMSALGAVLLPRLARGIRRRHVLAIGAVAVVALVLRVADFRPGRSLQVTPISDEPMLWRVALPVLLLAAILIALRTRRTAVATLALTLALVPALLTRNSVELVRARPGLPDFDAALARLAAEVEASTSPEATVATAAAGQLGYFSGREIVDTLGYTDAVIARSEPTLDYFLPGHDRWDVSYSVGELRPDVVLIGFPEADEDDVAEIRALGYDQLNVQLFVRQDSTNVDREALVRGFNEAFGL